MKRVFKVFGVLAGLFVAFLVIIYIHFFVWPFDKANPNFSHVEEVFNRMQFPSDWKVISESENNGLHGRRCEFESSTRCFHKAKRFKVSAGTKDEEISQVMRQSTCLNVAAYDLTDKSDNYTSTGFKCQVGQISIDGSIARPENEVYISVGDN